MAAALLAELPEGFRIHKTANYIICYNTSREYAQWCGGLLERLQRAFTNYWQHRGLDLHEPELPLVAIVFADAQSYRQYSQKELGEAAGSIVGYYSLRTNRVTMYDLTGVQALRRPGSRRGSIENINRMLSQPQAGPLVATVVHEATHQIAFNCGMHTRYADIPLWVSEGIALYFETPDLSSGRGWRGIGSINPPRLSTFRRNLPHRTAGMLPSLIADDRRMREVTPGADAYAEAWALSYYLIHRRPKEFVEYLAMLAKKPQLVWDEPEQRLAKFREYFGEDLQALEQDFLRQMQTVR
jgi:hypothetical protein